jgi:hypothetical protein
LMRTFHLLYIRHSKSRVSRIRFHTGTRESSNITGTLANMQLLRSLVVLSTFLFSTQGLAQPASSSSGASISPAQDLPGVGGSWGPRSGSDEPLQPCTSPSVRKEWRTLSASEKKNYLDAVNVSDFIFLSSFEV